MVPPVTDDSSSNCGRRSEARERARELVGGQLVVAAYDAAGKLVRATFVTR